jgi:hypothetical protein
MTGWEGRRVEGVITFLFGEFQIVFYVPEYAFGFVFPSVFGGSIYSSLMLALFFFLQSFLPPSAIYLYPVYYPNILLWTKSCLCQPFCTVTVLYIVIKRVFHPEVTLPSCSRGGITVNFLCTPNRIVYALEHGKYDLKTARAWFEDSSAVAFSTYPWWSISWMFELLLPSLQVPALMDLPWTNMMLAALPIVV